MKLYYWATLLVFFCLSANAVLFAQSPITMAEKLVIYDKIYTQEKIYLQTDRTLYQAGECIWFSSWLVGADNKLSSLSSSIIVELIDPKGNVVETRMMENKTGTTSNCLLLEGHYAGGIYTLRASSSWMSFLPTAMTFEKKITLQKVLLPDVLMKLDFEKEAYGSGDTVQAVFTARNKQDRPLADRQLNYTVQVAGKTILEQKIMTDATGKATLQYVLPNPLTTRGNLVNITFDYAGQVQSISRSAPIVLGKLDVQLLPEGGNLLANQPNRVAIKVLNEFGKPADITAALIDETGQLLQTFSTYHQGMGAFIFMPQNNKRYRVKILKPTNISTTYDLPIATANTVNMLLQQNGKKEVVFDVHNATNEALKVLVQQQGKVLLESKINATTNKQLLSFATPNLPMGIVQVTLLDQDNQPKAERLVFVNKHRQIKATITTDKKVYRPEEIVKVWVKVKDETGKGVQGKFSAAVVNDKNLSFIDDKQANILSSLLLSSELRGKIYEPNFYFDATEPKADAAMDYVMLTHGWRRFEWETIAAISPDEQPLLFKEINGIFYSNGLPLLHHQILLSTTADNYDSTQAVATLYTDHQGYFCFNKLDDLPLPLYISAKDGKFKQSILVERYSKPRSYVSPSFPADNYTLKYQTKDSVALQGTVYSSYLGIKNSIYLADVEVWKDTQLILSTQTNRDGQYSFEQIPAGHYIIRFYDRDTYYTNRYAVLIDSEHTAVLKTNLRPVAILTDDEEGYSLPRYSSYNYFSPNTPALLSMSDMTYDYNSYLDYINNDSYLHTKYLSERKRKLLKKYYRRYPGKRPMEQNIDTKFAVVATVYTPDPSLSIGHVLPPTQNVAQPFFDDYPIDYVSANTSVNSLLSSVAGIRAYYPSHFVDDYVVDQTIVSSSSFQTKHYLVQLSPIPKPRYTGIARYKDLFPPYQAYKNPFRTTIHWESIIETRESGYASFMFQNDRSSTTARIVLEGIGGGGEVVHAETTYVIQLPATLTAVIPPAIYAGDTVQVPITIENNTSLDKYVLLRRLLPKGIKEITPDNRNTKGYWVAADSFHTFSMLLTTTDSAQSGTVELLITQVSNMETDVVTVVHIHGSDQPTLTFPISVYPKGFPQSHHFAAQQVNYSDTFVISKPLSGSLNGTLQLYPNPNAELAAGTASILRAPYGCFEQVSSSNYPNILALQLLQSTQKVDRETKQKALEYLKSGYAKLAAYEIRGGGFEWYGRAPAHEGLTAYGLVQFHDMKKVYYGVEQQIIDRTEAFLLSRRNGLGGYKQQVGKYGFGGKRDDLFDAYITWALTEVQTKTNLQKELQKTKEAALKDKDPYLMSLAALAHYNTGDSATALLLTQQIETLLSTADWDAIRGAYTLTYSGTRDNHVETMAWMGLVLLRANQSNLLPICGKIATHLLPYKRYGGYGATQATIMALKFATQFHSKNKNISTQKSKVNIWINDQLAVAQDYVPNEGSIIQHSDLQQYLKVGTNVVRVAFDEGSPAISFEMATEWKTELPNTDTTCALQLQTTLANSTVALGQTVRMTIQLTNKKSQLVPSPMAAIGIPSGLSLQPWQLEQLQSEKAFDYYEIIGSYLYLYYSEMDANATKNMVLDLKTEVAGQYYMPASSAYLYYDDQHKSWASPKTIQINAQ